MNAAQSNQPRQAPGAHNPEFATENPALTWIKENKGYLAFLFLVITGIASYQHFWPRFQRGSLTESWMLYQDLVSDQANFQAEKVAETLSRSRTDERIHPWVVHAGVTAALNRNDREALTALRSELQTLATNVDLAGFRLVGESGPEGIFAYSLGMVDKALAPEAKHEFANPAPTGQTIRFTLTVNDTDSYDFEAGLYPEASPAAVAAFLGLLESGQLTGQAGLRKGAFGFEFRGAEAGDPNASELKVERTWGYFHLAGALSLAPAFGKSGHVDDQSFELQIQDAPHLDGASTVLGMLTSGLEHLDRLQGPEPGAQDPIQSVVLTAIELVEA